MFSVTQRIAAIKQPRGGYIKPKTLNETQYEDNKKLNINESISPQYMGVVIDYLTRLKVTNDPYQAFDIPIMGARYEEGCNRDIIDILCEKVMSDDPVEQVTAACCFLPFDVAFRIDCNPNNVAIPQADDDTVENICIMVDRGTKYLNEKGILKAGFVMTGAYTDTISSGDGDYLTNDAVVDFKVSKRNITSAHTLQVLIYYLMGLKSIYPEFKQMRRLALFNPRKNIECSIDIKDIPQEVVDVVCSDVIGCKRIVTAKFLK